MHEDLSPNGTLYNCTEFSDFNVIYLQSKVNKINHINVEMVLLMNNRFLF